MSIIPRPLKQVLGKIIPFSKDDKIPTFNLGSGTADESKVLTGDGNWTDISSLPTPTPSLDYTNHFLFMGA
jgi:hypothetical protein